MPRWNNCQIKQDIRTSCIKWKCKEEGMTLSFHYIITIQLKGLVLSMVQMTGRMLTLWIQPIWCRYSEKARRFTLLSTDLFPKQHLPKLCSIKKVILNLSITHQALDITQAENHLHNPAYQWLLICQVKTHMNASKSTSLRNSPQSKQCWTLKQTSMASRESSAAISKETEFSNNIIRQR